MMVTSATYRQSSKGSRIVLDADPENQLHTRRRRTRLDGEAIRDSLLQAGGSLSQVMGGPPIYPDLPRELTRLSSKGDVWPVSMTLEERSRRSLHVFVRRNLRFPFFEAFDRPDTNASCPDRGTTTIAPQALTLLNSRLSDESARAFSERLLKEAGTSIKDQIRLAFLIAFGRDPSDEDLSDAVAHLTSNPDLKAFCLALLNANEFVYID
jgi:hypothetical protein